MNTTESSEIMANAHFLTQGGAIYSLSQGVSTACDCADIHSMQLTKTFPFTIQLSVLTGDPSFA